MPLDNPSTPSGGGGGDKRNHQIMKFSVKSLVFEVVKKNEDSSDAVRIPHIHAHTLYCPRGCVGDPPPPLRH